MKKLIITIGDHTYSLKFGFGCFRILAEKWEVKGYPEVLERIVSVGDDIEKLEFDKIQILIDLVGAAVDANGDIAQIQSFNDDDCGDFLLRNPDKFQEIVTALIESMPKTDIPEQKGKPKAVKK